MYYRIWKRTHNPLPVCCCSDMTCPESNLIQLLWSLNLTFVLWYVFLTRCDDKAFKKLVSRFGSSRSEESCSAVVQLLERVTRLHKQLELRESLAEIDMDQVQTTTDFHHTRVGCCTNVCPVWLDTFALTVLFALLYIIRHSAVVCIVLNYIREDWWTLLLKWRASKAKPQLVAWSYSFHLTKPPAMAAEPPPTYVCVCLQLCLAGADHRNTPSCSAWH